MILNYRPGQSLHLELGGSSRSVLVGGCFDVLHYGHLRFLQQARLLGSDLYIALEPDKSIYTKKQRHAFHSQQQRAEILDALDVVTAVIKLPRLTHDEEYMTLVYSIKPAVIAITKGDPYAQEKSKQCSKIGADLVEISFEDGFSTTELLNTYSQ